MPSKPRAITRLAASFVATIGLALASVVWSESWFWGRWRPEDSAFGFAQTVLGYAIVVQVVRFVAARWRVAASGTGVWKRVFLAGALYGWLVEGVLVTTVIDDLPLSISYTGLAWHALFTVLLGWWWVPRQLERPVRGSLLRLAVLGVGVGAWASFWRFEEGAVTPVLEYAIFVALSTIAYAAGLAIWWWLRSVGTPGLPSSAAAILLLTLLAIGNAIANPLTLLGPALAAVAVLALIHTAPPPMDARLLPTAGPTPWRSLWRLTLVPVAATAVFALITASPEPIPTGWAFYIMTVPLALVLFVVAWVSARRDRREALV